MASEPRKRCSGCREELPLSSFYKRSDGGWRALCRKCWREYCVAYDHLHRDAINERKRRQKRGLPSAWGEVPVEPFQRWLAGRLSVYGTQKVLADATGMSERELARVLNGERKGVKVATVDRALVREGSTTLCLVYPMLYPEHEFDEEAA